MNRKAQMSSPLAYIFAIFIGGIIFLFLIGFAYNFLALGGSLSAAETVQALNDEFSAFSISESAEKIVDYKQDFEFTIYEGKITTNQQTQTLSQIVFAPVKIKGDQIAVATKTVEMPYKTTNVFYLSDNSKVYVFVYDSTTKEIVEDLTNSYDALPSNIPSYAFSTNDVEDNLEELAQITAQYDTVRFVFFTDYSSYENQIEETFSSYEIISVSSSEEDYYSGEVEFFDGEDVIYVSYPLLLGAIVSGDSRSYEYNLDLVLEKLAVVTGVYYEKSKFVSTRLPSCDYAAIKSVLSSYKNFVGEIDSYQEYTSKIENLEKANDALGGDCPEIY